VSKILVIGARGRAGAAAVAEAQERGHDVLGVARTAEGGLIAGDVTDAGRIAGLAAGYDAVIAGVYDGGSDPGEFFPAAARALVEGLEKAGVSRLVWVVLASILPTADGTLLMDTGGYPTEYRSFFRAHQAAYTDHAPDAADWGIAAFTGRSRSLAASLSAQDGAYTLITRGPDGDSAEVIGSLAATDPETTSLLIDEFGADRITLALDVRLIGGAPEIATAGWRKSTGRTVWEVAELYPQARHAMVTDIGRDGMLSGPNLELIAEFVLRHPDLDVQASGGVASAEDLRALRGTGAAGAIVGKAIWEARLDLAEAIDAGG